MTDPVMTSFAHESESIEEHWRSVVLFGRNVASYKFALAKSLLELAQSDTELVPLEELSVPFARHICEHIERVDRQGTFATSKFLDACRFFNAGRIDASELQQITVLLGFNNVIDAFHVVGDGDIPTRYFIDERKSAGGIRLTSELFALAERDAAADLTSEAEARWRLVEEAWQARASGTQLHVLYDAPRQLLVPALKGRRRPITEVRPALNGYQKGHCFYCFGPISVTDPQFPSDVDHFFPHSLMARGLPVDLDLPWNLVLTCVTCNRGAAGKFANVPAARYVERLRRRNEFLIASNHPLREGIMLVTGATWQDRLQFLNAVMDQAQTLGATRSGWSTAHLGPERF